MWRVPLEPGRCGLSARPVPLEVSLGSPRRALDGGHPTDLDHGVQPQWGPPGRARVARLTGGRTHGGGAGPGTGPGPGPGPAPRSGGPSGLTPQAHGPHLCCTCYTCVAPAPSPGSRAPLAGTADNPALMCSRGYCDAEGWVSLETGARALLPWGLSNAVVRKPFPGDLEPPRVRPVPERPRGRGPPPAALPGLRRRAREPCVGATHPVGAGADHRCLPVLSPKQTCPSDSGRAGSWQRGLSLSGEPPPGPGGPGFLASHGARLLECDSFWTCPRLTLSTGAAFGLARGHRFFSVT